MSDLDRTSVSLLLVVTLFAVLVKTASCRGGLNGSPSSVATQAAVGMVIVTGDSVNLRQAPTRSASVVARAEKGMELDLLGTQDDWYNVRWGEGTVWLSKLYASPTEDCPAEQLAAPESLLHQLPGEWKGKVGSSPVTFVFYSRNERLCAYALYSDVKEVLALAVSGPDTLTLTGQRYERLEGTTGPFWLDTFSGQLEGTSERLSGTYTDANSNGGKWFAQRPGSSSETASASTGEDEEQLTVHQSEPMVDPSQQLVPLATGSTDFPDQGDSRTTPVQVVSQPEEESMTSSSKGNVSRTESLFLGRWEGSGKQFNSRQRWQLQMNITSEFLGSTVGSIRYPSLRCGGDLVLTDVHEGKWTMREDITYGTNCITGGSITMTPTSPGQAKWLWYYPQGELGAQADVRQQSK